MSSVNPYATMEIPIVRTREVRTARTDMEDLTNGHAISTMWSVGGGIASKKNFQDLEVTLLERGEVIPLDDSGQFVVSRLRAGDYTLQVTHKGAKPKKYPLRVPAPDYELSY